MPFYTNAASGLYRHAGCTRGPLFREDLRYAVSAAARHVASGFARFAAQSEADRICKRGRMPQEFCRAERNRRLETDEG